MNQSLCLFAVHQHRRVGGAGGPRATEGGGHRDPDDQPQADQQLRSLLGGGDTRGDVPRQRVGSR